MKIMILVPNLVTRFHHRASRTEDRKVIKEDLQVVTRITPIFQVAQVDEDHLREPMEDHSNILVSINLKPSTVHRRVDLWNPRGGGKYPHRS